MEELPESDQTKLSDPDSEVSGSSTEPVPLPTIESLPEPTTLSLPESLPEPLLNSELLPLPLRLGMPISDSDPDSDELLEREEASLPEAELDPLEPDEAASD